MTVGLWSLSRKLRARQNTVLRARRPKKIRQFARHCRSSEIREELFQLAVLFDRMAAAVEATADQSRPAAAEAKETVWNPGLCRTDSPHSDA